MYNVHVYEHVCIVAKLKVNFILNSFLFYFLQINKGNSTHVVPEIVSCTAEATSGMSLQQ